MKFDEQQHDKYHKNVITTPNHKPSQLKLKFNTFI